MNTRAISVAASMGEGAGSRRTLQLLFRYGILIGVGFLMLYPLLWLITRPPKVARRIGA